MKLTGLTNDEKNFRTNGLLLVLSIVMYLSILIWAGGCMSSKKDSKLSRPRDFWAGTKGQQPNLVWQDYAWMIVSTADYECRPK